LISIFQPLGAIIAAKTYFYNLTYANEMTSCHQNSPLWEYEYSYISDYAMNGLSNEDFAKLVIKLENDDNYLQKYHQFYYRMSDMPVSCDTTCKNFYLDLIKTADAYSPQPPFDL
jgi:hypothetical protein